MNLNALTDEIAARKLRALVVDDQMLSREILCAELAEFGVQAEQASNGRDALAKVLAADQGRPFNIVFTDLRMPELNGLDLIAHIRQAGFTAAPMTVLVTAHDWSGQTAQHPSGTARPDKVLAKPATTSEVFNLLVAACGKA